MINTVRLLPRGQSGQVEKTVIGILYYGDGSIKGREVCSRMAKVFTKNTMRTAP